MASPRDLRRLALLALYQIEASVALSGGRRGEPGLASALPEDLLARVRDQLGDVDTLADEGLTFSDAGPDAPLSAKDFDRAVRLAVEAWSARERADRLVAALAPEWPTHRQAAVDRCILRLAIAELLREGATAPPASVINQAVELARQFSTEKSPSFVNALLDRVARDQGVL